MYNGREWVVIFRVCYLCTPNILVDDNFFWIHSPYSHYMVLFTSSSLPLLFISTVYRCLVLRSVVVIHIRKVHINVHIE